MAHSLKTKTKCRVMIESGKPLSYVEEKTGVSKGTLILWTDEGKWVKGKIEPKLYQKEVESVLRLAEKRGLTMDYFLGKVQTLCEATKPMLVKPLDSAHSREEGDESGGAFVQEVPDYRAISDGLDHAQKIIPGLKVSEKVDLGENSLLLYQELISRGRK